jgi:hypothetical protein
MYLNTIAQRKGGAVRGVPLLAVYYFAHTFSNSARCGVFDSEVITTWVRMEWNRRKLVMKLAVGT